VPRDKDGFDDMDAFMSLGAGITVGSSKKSPRVAPTAAVSTQDVPVEAPTEFGGGYDLGSGGYSGDALGPQGEGYDGGGYEEDYVAAPTKTKKSSIPLQRKQSSSSVLASRSQWKAEDPEGEEEAEAGFNEGEEEEEEEEVVVRTAPKRRILGSKGLSSSRKVVKSSSGKRRGVTSKQTRRQASVPSRKVVVAESEEDGGEGDFLSPGGTTDVRRVRKSLGGEGSSSSAGAGGEGEEEEEEEEEGGRYPKRRRWKKLEHWKGERIIYKEDENNVPFAYRAERIGVITPVLGGGGSRKRSRSKTNTGAKGRGRSASKSRGAAGKRGEEEEEEEGGDVLNRGIPKGALVIKGKLEDDPRVKKLVAAAMAKGSEGTARQPVYPKSSLPSDFKETTSPTLVIRAEGGEPMYQISVIRQASHLAYERLPNVGAMPPGLSKSALAAAAFDMHDFVSGTVRLRAMCLLSIPSPPLASKSAINPLFPRVYR